MSLAGRCTPVCIEGQTRLPARLSASPLSSILHAVTEATDGTTQLWGQRSDLLGARVRHLELSTTDYGEIDAAEAQRAAQEAIDHGITLFDTAES